MPLEANPFEEQKKRNLTRQIEVHEQVSKCQMKYEELLAEQQKHLDHIASERKAKESMEEFIANRYHGADAIRFRVGLDRDDEEKRDNDRRHRSGTSDWLTIDNEIGKRCPNCEVRWMYKGKRKKV